MKKLLLILYQLLPHAILILSLMMVTFYITDQFNRPMAFINNDITKTLLCLLAVLAIVQSVCMIRQNRK